MVFTSEKGTCHYWYFEVYVIVRLRSVAMIVVGKVGTSTLFPTCNKCCNSEVLTGTRHVKSTGVMSPVMNSTHPGLMVIFGHLWGI